MEGYVRAKLDPGFLPMEQVLRAYERDVRAGEHVRLTVAIERNHGYCEVETLDVFPDGVDDARNCAVIERLVKTLLWVYGGWRICIHGSRVIYAHLKAAYDFGGPRDFDRGFMSRVYERPFAVEYFESVADMPAERRSAEAIGRHLDGCRIGFDAGGSDRKVSAVIDGEAVFSEEVVWHPKEQADPEYHYQGIVEALRTAAGKMPRVDAIGVSSAGVYIDNRIMVASLFIKVPDDAFEKRVKNMYLDAAREIGADIPVAVANDGDVTALAGAMEMGVTGVLGIAMGTSEAGGYIDVDGNITGWINELAFVPLDMQDKAPVDDWSGDKGCGASYLSQDAAIRLARKAGIALDETRKPAENLRVVQALMEEGDSRARAVYETIGTYLGCAVAYYARFYDIRHVLIMGRVTSGAGGAILLGQARAALKAAAPELDGRIAFHIPDESRRRVGQSIAAASLPK